MAFTDHSDLLAAMHENGINATIGQVMLQAEAKNPDPEPASCAGPATTRCWAEVLS